MSALDRLMKFVREQNEERNKLNRKWLEERVALGCYHDTVSCKWCYLMTVLPGVYKEKPPEVEDEDDDDDETRSFCSSKCREAYYGDIDKFLEEGLKSAWPEEEVKWAE